MSTDIVAIATLNVRWKHCEPSNVLTNILVFPGGRHWSNIRENFSRNHRDEGSPGGEPEQELCSVISHVRVCLPLSGVGVELWQVSQVLSHSWQVVQLWSPGKRDWLIVWCVIQFFPRVFPTTTCCITLIPAWPCILYWYMFPVEW